CHAAVDGARGARPARPRHGHDPRRPRRRHHPARHRGHLRPSWDTMGHNEQLVGEAPRSWGGDRSQVVVATKGGITRSAEGGGRDGSAAYLRSALEKSLTALGTDSVDLYYWHRPDRSIRYADGVEALAALQQEGLIREIGISNANI